MKQNMRIGCSVIFLCFTISVWGLQCDSLMDQSISDSVTRVEVSIKKDNFVKRWWHGLIHGNVDRTFEKAMDWSIAIAPSYSREGSVGIGGMASALYRLDKTDSIMQPSDLSLSGSISLKGFYVLLVNGDTKFKGN